VNNQIDTAIKEHRVIRFTYEGGVRIVEPYAHGVSHENNEVVRCWQKEGFSSSGNPQGWKLFEVIKMTGLAVTQEIFHPSRSGYRRGDSAMRSIICEI
jgi:predicted DNA-binding transcriptional regulator YafY